MKATIVSVFLSIIASIVLLSGCTNQTPQNGTTGTTHDEFLVNSTGGDFEVQNGLVFLTIPADAVNQQTTITIDSVADPPYDTSLVLTNCYSFGPDGLSFSTPVDLTLKYDDGKVPTMVQPENLSLFVLSNTLWSKIDNCMVDSTVRTVTGQIAHFSMIGVGFIPPEELEHSSEQNDSENTSASITFEVPVQLYELETIYTPHPDRPEETDVSYFCCAYIAWAPSPYVRYYEVTVHYNNNNMHEQALFSTCDYRDWGKTGCTLLPSRAPDGRTIFIGPGTITYPNMQDYAGTYDNSPSVFGADKHGITVRGLYTHYDHTDGLTRGQIDAVEKEMYDFLTSYVQGWTYTIKNVS